MQRQDERLAPARDGAAGGSRKLRDLLRRRLRQLARATLVLASGLVVAVAALAISWFTSLNGLPDIGDPFDVAALRALRIPDDQNAFTYYRRASAMLTREPELPRPKIRSRAQLDWSVADPKLRAWVEANRPALALLRQGAELPDGIERPAGEPHSARNGGFAARSLVNLALLEGSRRQESGDTAGAWDWYRAVLRLMLHMRRRGNVFDRYLAAHSQAPLRERLSDWAADPRTSIAQIRRALDEARSSAPKPDEEAFSLKIEYLDMLRELPHVNAIRQGVDEEVTYRLGDLQVPTDLAVYLYAAQRFLAREPERSRRVLRLVFANWLAHVETPLAQQPRPVLRASLRVGKSSATVPLYAVSPQAPPGAHVLSPLELARWLLKTYDLKLRLSGWAWSVHLPERRAHRLLVILLAKELYRRERGMRPPSDEALVGTYLESLPDDGSAALDDATTPTVSDSPEPES